MENTKNIRTSQGTFLAAAMDPSGILQQVEEKIASVTHVHKMQGEAFNVLRYEIGQKYDQHQVYSREKVAYSHSL